MARLTNSIRDAISNDILKKRFTEEVQTLSDKYAELADAIYKAVMKDRLKRIQGLPKEWFPSEKSIYIRLGVEFTRLYFAGLTHHNGDSLAVFVDRKEESRPFTNDLKGNCVGLYDVGDVFVIEFNKLNREKEKIAENLKTARLMIDKTLYSVSTIEKLIEIWPEVEAIAKPYLEKGERKALLPDIPRAKLNDLLKLP